MIISNIFHIFYYFIKEIETLRMQKMTQMSIDWWIYLALYIYYHLLPEWNFLYDIFWSIVSYQFKLEDSSLNFKKNSRACNISQIILFRGWSHEYLSIAQFRYCTCYTKNIEINSVQNFRLIYMYLGCISCNYTLFIKSNRSRIYELC